MSRSSCWSHCIAILSLLFAASAPGYAQRFLTDMMDTSSRNGKGIYPVFSENDRLRFGGYMQPQFQYAQSEGAKNYSGGDFSTFSNNRFMLRRGRIRLDYSHFNKEKQPLAAFAFQFDGTERGVAIRDFWGRFYENKFKMFSVIAGMFARPMGYEVNLSSSDREAPERGRMSQILMKTERDLGVMLIVDSRRSNAAKWIKALRMDLGVFNGQGLAGTTDYDSHKDVIGRISLKPRRIKSLDNLEVSGAVSGYLGGIVNRSAWYYTTENVAGIMQVVGDSSGKHVHAITPRKYIGADIQLKLPVKRWATELRAEYMRGLQTATVNTSETPGSYPADAAGKYLPLYTRVFDGAYFTFLQNLGSERLQLILKYDWYDPNKKAAGQQLQSALGFTAADVRYDTFGAGLLYYINPHVRFVIYYDNIFNENTQLNGYTSDIKDNILTCRLQYRF